MSVLGTVLLYFILYNYKPIIPIYLLQKLYTEAWDKVKATGYYMPGDAVPIKQSIHTSKVQSQVSSEILLPPPFIRMTFFT